VEDKLLKLRITDSAANLSPEKQKIKSEPGLNIKKEEVNMMSVLSSSRVISSSKLVAYSSSGSSSSSLSKVGSIHTEKILPSSNPVAN
jgi:hypothetical protein